MTKHAEDLAKLGWQYFECPTCGSEGARAFPKPEQEPVAWWNKTKDTASTDPVHRNNADCQPLYTNPPQRTWVGLTDEDIFLVLGNLQAIYNRPPTEDSRVVFALAIEAKLKEKNK